MRTHGGTRDSDRKANKKRKKASPRASRDRFLAVACTIRERGKGNTSFSYIGISRRPSRREDDASFGNERGNNWENES